MFQILRVVVGSLQSTRQQMLAQAKGRLQRFRLVCFLALARVSTFTLRTHNQFALHYYAAIQLHHVPAGVGNWDGQFESIHDSITCNVGKEFGKASLVSTHHCCPTRSMPTRLPVGSIAGHVLLGEQFIILVSTFCIPSLKEMANSWIVKGENTGVRLDLMP